MAALLGVERGSAAAPRQPALVNASRRTPTQYNSSQKARPKTGASVHRHTRKDFVERYERR